MKILATILMVAAAVVARSETHAVLNAERNLIIGYENIDAGLVNSYRSDPTKAAKVAQYRLLVVPARPAATLQQVVEGNGTNINDGGFVLTDIDVTQVWRVRNLTPQEIASVNTATAYETSNELSQRMKVGGWEEGFLRMVKLNSEALYFLYSVVARANLHTNLTVPERTRANSVSNEVRQIYDLWAQGRSNYMFVLTNTLVVTAPTNWPAITIDE